MYKLVFPITLGLCALFLLSGVSCVSSGHVGVVTTFGKVSDDVRTEGMTWVLPWQGVHKLSIRTQENTEKSNVPTKEGLQVGLEVTMLYTLNPSKASEVYRTVGQEYEKVIIDPQFKSAMRSATVNFKSEDLYTSNREQVEAKILAEVKELLEPRGIIIQSVLLRDIELPSLVRERINAKLAADQDSQRMKFVLEKEKQEAERKKVEAKGIADAQQIIKKDLDENYLKYLWIEALKETAHHKNMMIYIPVGNDGMPIFKQVK